MSATTMCPHVGMAVAAADGLVDTFETFGQAGTRLVSGSPHSYPVRVDYYEICCRGLPLFSIFPPRSMICT